MSSVAMMLPTRLLSGSAALLACLLAAACATPPQKGLAPGDVPNAFAGPVDTGAPVWPRIGWWKEFRSAELDRLIGEASTRNLDIADAAAQIAQADAAARIAGTAFLPSGDVGVTGTHTGNGVSNTQTQWDFSGLLSVSYEIDVWGKNRASFDAAKLSARASRYNRETVALTTTASVATGYFQVLSLRDQLRITRADLAAAERVLALVEAQAAAGAASPLDVAQQRAQVAGQRATLPGLEEQEREALASLALLLGRPPQGFQVSGTSLTGLSAPVVKPGLPSELLTRRPDVKQAETALAAAHKDVESARAARFPSLTLTGTAGNQSSALETLMQGSNTLYNGGFALVAPLFDQTRLKATQDQAAAVEDQYMVAYRSAVLNAFSDVHVALGQVSALRRQESLYATQVKEAETAFNLAQAQYTAGAIDLMTVLDTQRTLFTARDSLSQARLARLQSVVSLYKALGGGWQVEDVQAVKPAVTAAATPAPAAK